MRLLHCDWTVTSMCLRTHNSGTSRPQGSSLMEPSSASRQPSYGHERLETTHSDFCTPCKDRSPSFLASCPAKPSYFNVYIFSEIQGFSLTSLPGSLFGKLPPIEKEDTPEVYFIGFPSSKDCCPAISVVQGSGIIASYILSSFTVVLEGG